MQYFREFATRDDVRRVVSNAAEDRRVQGVVIEFDPQWLRLWRLRQVMGPHVAERIADQGWPYPVDPAADAPYGGYDAPDPRWLPRGWVRWCEYLDLDPEPYIIRIARHLGEKPDDEFFGEAAGLRIAVERRPPASLQAQSLRGGVRIGSGTLSGTLGGLLGDGGPPRFGLTCSHVVGDRIPVTCPPGAGSPTIGGVVARSHLMESVNAQALAGAANDVDVALVQLDASVVADFEVREIGAVTGVSYLSELHQEMLVETCGGRSGHSDLRIGGLVVFYTLRLDGSAYAFSNLIELRHPSRMYGLFGMIDRPTRPGDSGAWVTSMGASGPQWCASVVGGDGVQGYAVPAEHTLTWLRSEGYGQLRPTAQ